MAPLALEKIAEDFAAQDNKDKSSKRVNGTSSDESLMRSNITAGCTGVVGASVGLAVVAELHKRTQRFSRLTWIIPLGVGVFTFHKARNHLNAKCQCFDAAPAPTFLVSSDNKNTLSQ